MRRNERGATMVEFAVILPLLLLLTMGIIEFAVLFNADSSAGHAARGGGRFAGVSSADPQLQRKAADAAASALDISPGTVQGSPTVCVAKLNASAASCGDFAKTFTLKPGVAAGDPTWVVDTATGTDWAVADRHFGCGTDPYDRVVVRVTVNHKLLVPGLFSMFFGGNDWAGLSGSSVFQLEPVQESDCPTGP